MRTGENDPGEPEWAPGALALAQRVTRNEARVELLISDMALVRTAVHDLTGHLMRIDAQIAGISKTQENLARIERNMDEQRADLTGHRAEASANFITIIGRIQVLDDKTDAALTTLGDKTNASIVRVNNRIDKLIWSTLAASAIALGWLVAWLLTHGVVTVHA